MWLRKPFKYTYFHASLFLIIINVLFYVALQFRPILYSYMALNDYNVIYAHAYWQFISYMFCHGSLSHLFFNMLALAFFGIPVEKTIGSKEFLLLYFVCGILSGFFSFLVYLIPVFGMRVFLAGASGSIYSILFAYAVCYPRSTIYIWGIIPVPAPILVLIYAIIAIVDEVIFVSNVANITHLFGLLTAWLYFLVRMGIHPLKIWKRNYR